MHGLATVLQGQVDDFFLIQIRFFRTIPAEQEGLVGLLSMAGSGVYFREDGHGADVQLLTGADDADGDLSAIGDQYLFKHDP